MGEESVSLGDMSLCVGERVCLPQREIEYTVGELCLGERHTLCVDERVCVWMRESLKRESVCGIECGERVCGRDCVSQRECLSGRENVSQRVWKRQTVGDSVSERECGRENDSVGESVCGRDSE